MSQSNLSVKFFRPPHRSVSCNNGMLDTKTKRTVAKDRFALDQERRLNTEQRRSSSYLRLLDREQKELEKRSSSEVLNRARSFSNGALDIRRSSSWNDTFSIHQNLLSLPQIDAFTRRFSACSDGTVDYEAAGDTATPLVTVCPPDDEKKSS